MASKTRESEPLSPPPLGCVSCQREATVQAAVFALARLSCPKGRRPKMKPSDPKNTAPPLGGGFERDQKGRGGPEQLRGALVSLKRYRYGWDRKLAALSAPVTRGEPLSMPPVTSVGTDLVARDFLPLFSLSTLSLTHSLTLAVSAFRSVSLINSLSPSHDQGDARSGARTQQKRRLPTSRQRTANTPNLIRHRRHIVPNDSPPWGAMTVSFINIVIVIIPSYITLTGKLKASNCSDSARTGPNLATESDLLVFAVAMAAYGQTQYSPAIQPTGPYGPYAHHAQGYSMPSYSEYLPLAWPISNIKTEDSLGHSPGQNSLLGYTSNFSGTPPSQALYSYSSHGKP
ncbi:hypothetical protein JZ751_017975 [Albula glossodonta]|uniref:Eyes absent homolog n=1 Tax=Albula glossodonta TaxID=121402 RepID=A0A8T2PPU4_9TELE|nr:hypothetical protein JZ751_017975 [Albula glossodonta]